MRGPPSAVGAVVVVVGVCGAGEDGWAVGVLVVLAWVDHHIFHCRAQPCPLTEPVVAHILFLAQELGVPKNHPILAHDSFPFPIVHLDFPVGMGVPDTVVLQPYNEWRDRTKVPYAAGEGRG